MGIVHMAQGIGISASDCILYIGTALISIHGHGVKSEYWLSIIKSTSHFTSYKLNLYCSLGRGF